MANVSYTRVNWQAGASGGTPLSPINLNKMDKGVADCATAINSANTNISTKATSLSLDGKTLNLLSADGTVLKSITIPDSWRGIQNNLNSTSATDSLSAAMGALLASYIPIKTEIKVSTLSAGGRTYGYYTCPTGYEVTSMSLINNTTCGILYYNTNGDNKNLYEIWFDTATTAEHTIKVVYQKTK